MMKPEHTKKSGPGSKKAPLGLIPLGPLYEVAEVFRLGAEKYGRFEYANSVAPASMYTDACRRHIYAWIGGEETDVESGRSHLAHAIADLLILMVAERQGSLDDDRPPPSTWWSTDAPVGTEDESQAARTND